MGAGDRNQRRSRRTPRRAINSPIALLRAGRFSLQQAAQIGEGGLLFAGTETFLKGDRIVVSLIIPGGGIAVTQGEVIYELAGTKGPLFGVKFEDISLQGRRSIRSYVSAKTQQEAEKEAQGMAERSGII